MECEVEVEEFRDEEKANSGGGGDATEGERGDGSWGGEEKLAKQGGWN